jgi:glycosyltransferase involved in cell wall biosynthesis
MAILHITEHLGVGGTEVLLKNTLPELTEYQHVVVYLGGNEELKESFFRYPVYCLEHSGKSTIFRSARRLRKICKQHQVSIIHAHLFWSSIIARLAKPANTRVVTTLHSVLSKDAFEKNKLSLWAERLTCSRQDAVIGVSDYVLRDYLQHTGYKGRTYVLYNFIPALFFKENSSSSLNSNKVKLRCIAVGNLKEVKNYPFLLAAFAGLDPGSFELDIVGEGSMRPELEAVIAEKNIPVKLLGSQHDLASLLPGYNVFIQASSYEGFGIAMAEAIAAGLIPVLSDIPVHREVTKGDAYYFSLHDTGQLTNLLTMIFEGKTDCNKLQSCREHIQGICSAENYFKRLRIIYHS